MTWYTTFGPATVTEQVWQHQNQRIRPLQYCGITHRSYSLPLQQAITDFGAEESFQRTQQRLAEHYRIQTPLPAIRKITERHARCAAGHLMPKLREPVPAAIVTAIDGTMLPTVVCDRGGSADARKRRRVEWREMRLCVAQPVESATPTYHVTLGDSSLAGSRWQQAVQQCHPAPGTYIHAVSDGAPWIVEQYHKHFAGYGQFLIDFYHVCDYLSAVGLPPAWLTEQKAQLMKNQWVAVVRALQDLQLQAALTAEQRTAAQVAENYILKRKDYLDYQGACQRGLPIGSGKIEGSHRSVLQKRLKLSGAWWQADTLQAMAELRVLRANNQWPHYWAKTLENATT